MEYELPDNLKLKREEEREIKLTISIAVKTAKQIFKYLILGVLTGALVIGIYLILK